MVDRRKFLTLTTAAATAPWFARDAAAAKDTIAFKTGGEGYSHYTGTEFESVPSICGQCPSKCSILAYTDAGRLVKIEGQPDSIRNQGKVCAKGQAGVTKLYDPDRIMRPMRRSGPRGSGQWQEISWDEALDDLAARLRKLRDEGRPEGFLVQHGWLSTSAEHLLDEVFMPAYGSASVVRQTCHGQSARWTAHELTWGGVADSWDFDNTGFVLNFGSNVLEADTNHVSLARRLAGGHADGQFKMVTFDVRLSNTAAKSDRWLPVKPGSDLAVALAMCQVIVEEGLYQGAGEEFLRFCRVTEDAEAPLPARIEALRKHLAEYTPAWAETISGVDAQTIEQLAREFATTKPACVISSRGASAHHNGVETERAIQMLAALTGNIDIAGGRCRSIKPAWEFPAAPENSPPPRRMSVLDLPADKAALPQFGAGQSLLKRLKASSERPGVYLWVHHNPAYTGIESEQIAEILRDESVLPFTVAVTPFYDESAALADLILPDATYLEKFEVDAGSSPAQVPEYALRQPVVEPLGESRDFQDVCCQLAKKLDIELGFDSAEDFVQTATRLTPDVKRKARGFRGLQSRGVWHDSKAAPLYQAYAQTVDTDALAEDGVILDAASGVYWNWRQAGLASEQAAIDQGYLDTVGASKAYVAQRIGESAYVGFKPGRLNKSGLFELYSPLLAAAGLAPLPSYVAIPEHARIEDIQAILTTFKVNVQMMSSTGNSRWLAEIQHDNPAWINPLTASRRSIVDGDAIVIKSTVGAVAATARVTHAVAPGVVAIATHAGRSQGGRYASGERAPFAIDDRHAKYQWWPAQGTHINRIIVENGEPVSGQQNWMDTLVTIAKA